MEYGILLDWGDVNDKETNPDWMRQKKPKPYKRGMSFFSAKRASQTASTIIMDKNTCVKMHQVENRGIRSRKLVQ